MSAHSHDHTAVAPAEVLDPVCGMTISPTTLWDTSTTRAARTTSAVRAVSTNFAPILTRFSPSARTSRDTGHGTRIHVPDGSGGAPTKARCVPEMRMALEPVDVAPITKVEWTCPMPGDRARCAGRMPDLRNAPSPERSRSRDELPNSKT